MLSDGFPQAAPLLPLGAFNHLPQCLGLGRTSQGAYSFAGNVVPEALRLVSQGFQAPAFRRGVTDRVLPFCGKIMSYGTTFSTFGSVK